ncbi:hypothetical protein [Edaphobacillus lindanitolerans]|uniref:Uncharacterized protein n=1 Tax=Edaphobacillus lindanitolerans TaxID=550447 RepID=A0A1U7PK42_9BACI|nr:hypothetical protein [Edaphobacillus lindanitolerans]SIT72121.1 hypothetical protein SAMN05428946_0823 [Edaphobacillus lindanitolerans]
MKKFYAIVLLIAAVLILPVALWFMEDRQNLSVAILDKTVPDESYREHLGLGWVLNHYKVGQKDFEEENDFFGFRPDENGQDFEIRGFPDDYAGTDVIYLADTYGVYEEDLPWRKSGRAGSRSKMIYGGLEPGEWGAIEKRLDSKDPSLFIAEYNSFASPTGEEVREAVTRRLGVEWSGWTGRFFEELDPEKNEEVPQWIVDEHGEKWGYSGPGFVLVNDFDGEIAVLEREPHLTGEGVRLSFTEEGEKRLGLDRSPRYDYWFDIVTPRPGAVVLATYDWGLTEEGKQLLAQRGIPDRFAAITANRTGPSQSIYFAGDYNDVPTVPKFYQVKGLPVIYRALNTFSEESFYWSAYVPVMKSVLDDFVKGETSEVAEKTGDGKVSMPARMNGDKLEVRDGKGWKAITVKGVNIGMGKPGHFPGEAAIEESDYYRWFESIGEMNANTVRVYTLHPPGFYRALKRYNESHEEPIHVMHGVWINEENLVKTQNAYDPLNVEDFQAEMKRLVDVVHGNADLEARPGHASGVYDADVSDWVSAWMVGVEWDPVVADETNKKNKGVGEYDGKYFKTEGARPFEHWIANQMDVIVSYEMDRYRTVRPMSFTNWVTTDLLEHPADSSDREDLVTIDPNLIYVKGEMEKAGQFASYHVYPYYPDFLNYEKKYREFTDFRGDKNNYAAYLKELHAAHRLPILIAEFGIPASRGKTHENPFGWNQGFMSEKQQGEVLTRLYEDILHEGLMGGLVFTWQDEWFKRTWNTMDYDNPDRRPFWSNAQTNEQQFGLLSFDRLKVKVDGNADDWTGKPVYEKDGGVLRKMFVDHDERYMYVRLDMDGRAGGYPVILMDTVPGQGNTKAEKLTDIRFSDGMEFMAVMDGEESRLVIDPYYDFHHYEYGKKLGLIPDVERVKDSGRFIPIEYALNKPYFIPNENRTLPFSAYETGKLKEGNGNPEAGNYDSLADYHMEKGMLELRIPWLLIQAKDPSLKEFMGDLAKDGEQASVVIDRIGLGALFVGEDGRVNDSFPAMKDGVLGKLDGYSWEEWHEPKYEERLKQSYWIMKKTFEGE